MFSTLIVIYLSYLGKDRVGPTPAEVLSLPLVLGTTVCLLVSSLTIHPAERALRIKTAGGFLVLWAATIALGIVFLLGTAYRMARSDRAPSADDQPQPLRHDVLHVSRIARAFT